ncbi:MAG: hypothetical protein ACOX9B_00115 [Candidatus Xenobium sp.]|jgi:drug/metabolite transporter (DMT)-like permease
MRLFFLFLGAILGLVGGVMFVRWRSGELSEAQVLYPIAAIMLWQIILSNLYARRTGRQYGRPLAPGEWAALGTFLVTVLAGLLRRGG